MRTSSLLLLLLLLVAGCSPAVPDAELIANVEAEARARAADGGTVECAKAGETSLTRACTIERTASADGVVLTVRHPDGAFHRLLVTTDGRGVVAADGAVAAKVGVVRANEIEVSVGGSRYRLPATVGPVARP